MFGFFRKRERPHRVHTFNTTLFLYWEGGGGESRCWEYFYQVCETCGKPVMYSRRGNVSQNQVERRGFTVKEVAHPSRLENPHYEQWKGVSYE